MLRSALDSGRAAERFQSMVAALGGPADLLENPDRHLPVAPVIRPVHARQDGIVTGVATRELGMTVVRLGGGRTRADQAIDHAVGLSKVIGLGHSTGPECPLAIIHARTEDDAERAASELQTAFTIGDTEPAPNPVVYERVSPLA